MLNYYFVVCLWQLLVKKKKIKLAHNKKKACTQMLCVKVFLYQQLSSWQEYEDIKGNLLC